MRIAARVFLTVVCLLSVTPQAWAQADLPAGFDGPAAPQLPATIARDAEGRTSVRAVRLPAPLRVDGLLDEPIYASVTPMSDFVQAEPDWGMPATEKTEVWISFDASNVYVSVRASESDVSRMVLNELRRDSQQLFQNEHITVSFDSFYDRRNAMNFTITPIGGRGDGQVSNEGNYSGDWNPVWNMQVRRNPGGWTGEMAIPFKSIRYRSEGAQVWGLQIRRRNVAKNEYSYLTGVPRGQGLNGIFRVSRFATLVGLVTPPGGRALDIKPYLVSDVSTDLSSTPQVRNTFGRDVGLDVKYAVTQGLTADITVNTDFAQVEADEQQVNLTRFSLFFPEKRDFFIENQGVFTLGGAGMTGGETPILFYSRRIGLEQGQQVPIVAGGRLTGRVGAFTLGLVNIQTGDIDERGIPSTNFTVARVRRDLLGRSSVGALVTRRSTISGGSGGGETYAIDGNFPLTTNLTTGAFFARTHTPGLTGDDTSHRAFFNYNHDRYGWMMESLVVGDNFNPEVGFVRRDDFHKLRTQVRFSPRPVGSRLVRKYFYQASAEYFSNSAGQKETRELLGQFQIDFQNGDGFDLSYNDSFELIPAPFRIARGVTVPQGGYDLRTFRGQYSLGTQRLVSGTMFVESGAFYAGDRTAFGFSGGRVKLHPQFSVEPGLSVNRVQLPFGDFTTTLVSSRLTYTVTPMMFVSSLVQYNSSNSTLSANVRLRWEYRPGSELFVVFNEGRDTTLAGYPDLQNRALVVKVNRLLRF